MAAATACSWSCCWPRRSSPAIILRITALQGLLGPIGLINMALAVLRDAAGRRRSCTRRSPRGIGLVYLFMPFMVTAIYLSLVNFDFALLEAAKINGAGPGGHSSRSPGRSTGSARPSASCSSSSPASPRSLTPRFLGGPSATSFGMSLGAAVRRDRHLGARLGDGRRPVPGFSLPRHPGHGAAPST